MLIGKVKQLFRMNYKVTMQTFTFTLTWSISVPSRPLSVSNSLSLCEHSESLPCDVLDCTLSCDHNILVVSEQALVYPIDGKIESSSKGNLCPPSVSTCSLNEGTLSCDESDATVVDLLVTNLILLKRSICVHLVLALVI